VLLERDGWQVDLVHDGGLGHLSNAGVDSDVLLLNTKPLMQMW